MPDNNQTLLSITETPASGGSKQFDVGSVLDARQAAFGGQKADELLDILANRTLLAQQQDFETQRILGAIAKIGFSLATGDPLSGFSGLKDILSGKKDIVGKRRASTGLNFGLPEEDAGLNLFPSGFSGSSGRSEPVFFDGAQGLFDTFENRGGK